MEKKKETLMSAGKKIYEKGLQTFYESAKLNKTIKKNKVKKGETLVLDEASERDKFNLSFGNLQVLKTIPDMMKESKWRKKLRMLVLEYLSDQILHPKLQKR